MSRSLLLLTLCSLLSTAAAARATTAIPQDGMAGIPRAFSPDGSLLVTSGGTMIELWRPTDRVVLGRHDLTEPVSGATFTAASGHDSWICGVGVLADGTLVSADGQGFLTFRDPLTLEIQAKFIDDEPDKNVEIAVHPDGERVAVVHPTSVVVYDAADGERLRSYELQGTYTSFGCGRGTRHEQRTSQPFPAPLGDVTWRPDGNALAVRTRDRSRGCPWRTGPSWM